MFFHSPIVYFHSALPPLMYFHSVNPPLVYFNSAQPPLLYFHSAHLPFTTDVFSLSPTTTVVFSLVSTSTNISSLSSLLESIGFFFLTRPYDLELCRCIFIWPTHCFLKYFELQSLIFTQPQLPIFKTVVDNNHNQPVLGSRKCDAATENLPYG